MEANLDAPDCIKDITAQCKNELHKQICQDEVAPLILSTDCCIYINELISYQCYTHVLVNLLIKEVEDLHLCTNQANQLGNKGNAIWYRCNYSNYQFNAHFIIYI